MILVYTTVTIMHPALLPWFLLSIISWSVVSPRPLNPAAAAVVVVVVVVVLG